MRQIATAPDGTALEIVARPAGDCLLYEDGILVELPLPGTYRTMAEARAAARARTADRHRDAGMDSPMQQWRGQLEAMLWRSFP